MKELLVTGRRYEQYFLPMAFLITLLPFFLLALYNHPSADDFCFTDDANSMGFWSSQAHYYFNWTGRYTSTALLTFYPIDHNHLAFYRLLPIGLLFFFAGSIYLFLKKLLARANTRDRILLSGIILFPYLVKAPNITEAFYWMAGSVTYQLASILTLLLISTILHIHSQKTRMGKIGFTLIGSLIVIATIGLNETSMLVLSIVLLFWLLIRTFWKKHLDVPLVVLFLVTIASSVVVIGAPGNLVRMSEKPDKYDFLFSLTGSIEVTALHFIQWLPMLMLLILFFLHPLNRIASRLSSRNLVPSISLVHLVVMFGFFFGFLVVCFFPSFWSQGGPPPSRTVNVIYLLFILGYLALTVFFLVYWQQRGGSIYPGSSNFRLVAGLGILALIGLRTNTLRSAYKDLVTGTAHQYDLEMKERYRLLTSCASDYCAVPRLEHIPSTILAYDLAPEPSSEVFYYNECLADYFNKAHISIRK